MLSELIMLSLEEFLGVIYTLHFCARCMSVEWGRGVEMLFLKVERILRALCHAQDAAKDVNVSTTVKHNHLLHVYNNGKTVQKNAKTHYPLSLG